MTSVPPPGWREASGSWGFRAPAPGASPTPSGPGQLNPLSRRLLMLAAGLSVLLIALVGFAWIHGSDEISLNPIARAAVRTQQEPGARIAIHAVITSSAVGGDMTMDGIGAYNARTGRTRQTTSMEIPGSDSELRFVAIGDARLVYLRSKVLTASLPPQVRWLAFRPALGGSAEAAAVGNADSRSQLEMLRAAGGEVETIGEETVRDVPTTRYRGTVDLHRYADLLEEQGNATAAHEYDKLATQMPAPSPVEVWLDQAGLLRRMRIVTEMPPEPGDPPLRMDLRLEFFDFGITPKIALPQARETFDSTPLARAELNLLNGRSLGIPTTPGSGPPLSPRAFRKRAEGICKRTEARISHLTDAGEPLGDRIQELIALDKTGRGDRAATLRALYQYGNRYMEPSLRSARRGMRRLAALSPPPRLRAAVRRLLHFDSVALEIQLAEARGLEIGRLSMYRKLRRKLLVAGRGSERAAREAGVKTCATEVDSAS